MTNNNYESLQKVLNSALDQASCGKGNARHAYGDEPFEKQVICEICRRLSNEKTAGALFQAVKKIYESGRLEKEAAINELYGAINYIAAAIILLKEE